jgi:hypothetical protein
MKITHAGKMVCCREGFGAKAMKKIPVIFKRVIDGSVRESLPEVNPGFEWFLNGEGVVTEKVDGSACAIINGVFYRRYDANEKRGRKPPAVGIPCGEPDPVTGHWPWWVPMVRGSSSDRWYWEALKNTPWVGKDGTYEAVGPHFQNNPYGLDADFLEKHGRIKVKDFPRNFEGVRDWLAQHDVEGVVVWKDGEPAGKIKRRDFGFEWPVCQPVEVEDDPPARGGKYHRVRG